MKKMIIALMAIIMVGNACKKDSIEEPIKKEPAHKNLLIKRVDNDGLVFNYTYDANNRLINYTRTSNPYNPSQNFTFTYNSNGTLAEMVNNNNSKTVFSYHADGTISKRLEYNGTGASATLVNTFLYSYAAGVVTENYVFAPTGGGWRDLYTYDSKGNLMEVKSYTTTSSDPIGTFSGTTTYKNYDDKPYHASSVPAAFFFPNQSINNVGIVTYSWGSVPYTYEYNEDGYPTKKSDGTNTSTFEYKRL